MKDLFISLKLSVATLLLCCVAYPLLILAVAKTVAPDGAEGHLLRDASGRIVGSRLIAQKFSNERYLWPRPSAVDYNAAGAGGSNKSPTSADLKERAHEQITLHGATAESPLPAELATASGAGLDPHLTEHAARYQAQRIATARGLDRTRVEALIQEKAFASGGIFAPERLVNVLELNLALDLAGPPPER
jgi:K+-transporting ATPase ATPase C chain